MAHRGGGESILPDREWLAPYHAPPARSI